MASVGTPPQARTNLSGTPERALRACVGFGNFCRSNLLPLHGARLDIKRSGPQAYDCLGSLGIECLPVANRRPRDHHGDGTSLPRHHAPWGTSLSRLLARSRSGRCENSDVRWAEAVSLLSDARDDREGSRASEWVWWQGISVRRLQKASQSAALPMSNTRRTPTGRKGGNLRPMNHRGRP